MFVSIDLSVNIAISHGSDGKGDEDEMGTAKAIFAALGLAISLRKWQ